MVFCRFVFTVGHSLLPVLLSGELDDAPSVSLFEVDLQLQNLEENNKFGLLEKYMELKKLEYDLTVCKVEAITDIDMTADFFFIGKTDEEMSLVCKTNDVPKNTTERDDGWKGFRIQGVLDFSLIGILSKLSGILAENNIGIFAVSTFNTDYILIKTENYEKALSVLSAEGYTIV